MGNNQANNPNISTTHDDDNNNNNNNRKPGTYPIQQAHPQYSLMSELPNEHFTIENRISDDELLNWNSLESVHVPTMLSSALQQQQVPTAVVDPIFDDNLQMSYPIQGSIPRSIDKSMLRLPKEHQFQQGQQQSQLHQKSSRKRRKSTSPIIASSSSVRKRTLTAYETYRIKKVKYDLNKLTCTNCIKLSMKCIYRQTNVEPVVQPTSIPLSLRATSDEEEIDEQSAAMAGLAKAVTFSSNENGHGVPVWSSCKDG